MKYAFNFIKNIFFPTTIFIKPVLEESFELSMPIPFIFFILLWTIKSEMNKADSCYHSSCWVDASLSRADMVGFMEMMDNSQSHRLSTIHQQRCLGKNFIFPLHLSNSFYFSEVSNNLEPFWRQTFCSKENRGL